MLNQDIVIIVGCLMIASIFLYVYLMCRMRDDHDYAELAHPEIFDSRVNRVRNILGQSEIPYDCETITTLDTLVPDNFCASDQPANSRLAEFNQLQIGQHSQNQLCQQSTNPTILNLLRNHKQRRLSSCSIVTISSNSSSSLELQLQSAEITSSQDSLPAPDEILPQELNANQNGTS